MNLPFTGNPPLGPLPVQEPVDYFRDLFDDELLLRIVDESNKYALQIDINKPLGLTQAELEQFIGILYLMSIVRMPSQRDYWSQSTVSANIQCHDKPTLRVDQEIPTL